MRCPTNEILFFLWRWKLVSTAALLTRFFPGEPPINSYKKLRRLWRRGLITRLALDANYTEFVCTLTRKGFDLVREKLPMLREEGYRSETKYHDSLVAALHLGDWLQANPVGTAFVTEQELRRLHPHDYPNWIPRTAMHRPDGYWRVVHPEGVGTIALEVELRKKKAANYDFVSRFYRDHTEIFRVVWLVSRRTNIRKIQSQLTGDMHSVPIHTFVLERDLRALGWEAPLHLGQEAGKPLSFLLGKTTAKPGQTLPFRSLFDLRKFPAEPARCAKRVCRLEKAQSRTIPIIRLPTSLVTPASGGTPTIQDSSTVQEGRKLE